MSARSRKSSTDSPRRRRARAGHRAQLVPDPLRIKEALVGESEAANKAHGVARAAFMNLLLTDTRVQHLFQSWRDRFGVSERLRALENAPSLSAVARAMEACKDPANFAMELEDSEHLAHAAEFLERGVEVVHEGVEHLPATVLADEATAFVFTGLGLSWAWLALALIEAFVTQVYAEPLQRVGLGLEIRLEVDSTHPAPLLKVPAFTTKSDESAEEAFERLLDHVCPAVAQLVGSMQERRLPTGRIRGDYTTYARWFYRARICGETVSALAREYHQRSGHACKGDSDRKTVRDGIKAAGRVLGLGQFELLPPQSRRANR